MIGVTTAILLCVAALLFGVLISLAASIVVNQHQVPILDNKSSETMFAEQFFILNLVQYIHLKLNHPQIEHQWREVLRVLHQYGSSKHFHPNPYLRHDPIGSLHYGLMYFVQDEETKNNIHDVVAFILSESNTHELEIPIDLDPKVVAIGVSHHPLLK